MPKVMMRKTAEGKLTMYVAKKDLEDEVVSLQYPGPGQWGGEMQLSDGSRYELDVLPEVPRFPLTLRAKRLD